MIKIDNRFFNRTIFVATVFSILLIVWFSLRGSKELHQDFKEQWLGSSEWNTAYIRLLGSNDSTRIQNLPKPLIIYFWSGWSDISIEGLKTLSEYKSESITLVAAVVKDTEEASARLDSTTTSLVHLAHGTYLYFDKKVTAVPTFLYLDADGVIRDIQIGKKSVEDLESLVYLKQ